jgi:pimeloyl-ACP methyl ester carboxylesterase
LKASSPSKAIALGLLLAMHSQMKAADAKEQLTIRIHGNASLPTLVYLPGLHGDWTLATSLRHVLDGKVRFVEFTYPRTLTWSLNEYSDAIDEALAENGITCGWLLGESFGSQIVWPLARKSQTGLSRFRVQGIVLAGGFVRHPNAPSIAIAKGFMASLPHSLFTACMKGYARYAKFRHRRAPETLAAINEFLARRTEADRHAMTHRLNLILANNVESTVRGITIPVYALSGFWDPIVPRSLTRRWLRKNCPGYCAAKTIFTADHNVLGTQPAKAAGIILTWMNTLK